jgi:hypothetical protein
MIEFDAEKHIYTVDNKIMPSVSQILDSCFPFPEYVPKAKRQYALDLGTAVDLMVEYDLAGTLDTSTLGMLEPYYDCWIKAKLELNIKTALTKQVIYHTLGYCGTLDLITDDFLADIKSGKEYPQARLQTAAYLDAWNQDHEKQINRRLAIYLSDSDPKIVEHTSENDFRVFLACLEVYKFKHPYAIQN